MTEHSVFFDLSQGISKAIQVPIGTCEEIRQHVDEVTASGGLKVIQYKNNPPHWDRYTPSTEVPNEIASNIVINHNRFVRWLYYGLAEWSKNPPKECEELTPEFAASIWYGLSTLELPVERWSSDYYQTEMQKLFNVMTTGECDGIAWTTDKLTRQQAIDVVHLFESYLDRHDIRLEMPIGRDYFTDEYVWCENCGIVADEDSWWDSDRDAAICAHCDSAID
ncbi:MAG: hypothetical protein KDK05_03850 [Candidatus Competibacteraceae bacterium]|nr:hypothetical protein [Candidatus Competibacteraceae bacterium]